MVVKDRALVIPTQPQFRFRRKILALQVALLAVTLFAYRKFGEPKWLPDRFFTGLLVLFVIATVGERIVYAYSSATGLASISSLTQKVPYYLGVTARGLFAKMGVRSAVELAQLLAGKE